MASTKRKITPFLGRLLVLGGVFGIVQALPAAQPCVAPDPAALSKDVAKYKHITVTVDDCIVQLNGQVSRLSKSWDVERKFRKAKWATGVANNLTVDGPTVNDKSLQRRVNRMLSIPGNNDSRAPLGSRVHDGVVTMVGGTSDPMMLDTACYAIASIKGVRSIVSSVQLDPMVNIEDILQWTPKTVLRRDASPGPMIPKTQR